MDNIERLIEWSSLGKRYDNGILQTIMVLLTGRINKHQKMTILLSSCDETILDDLEVLKLIDHKIKMPTNITQKEINDKFNSAGLLDFDKLDFDKDETKPDISDVFKTLKHH